jgi:Zn-dependent M28 family amino/carboxypeptidase
MQSRFGLLVVVLSLSFVISCGSGSGDDTSGEISGLALPDGIEKASEVITETLLQNHVTILGGDEMEGRGPGSDGDRRARRYLTEQMQRIGLQPAFPNGAWEQPLTIVGVTGHVPDTWVFSSKEGSSLALALGADYVGGAGRQEAETTIENAPVVFVGYGIEAPEENWNDFKDADLEGAILLMLNDDPDWDEGLFGGDRKLWYGRWDYKYISAARRHAAGAIIIHTTPSAGYPWTVVQTGWTGEQFELVAGDEPRLGIQSWVTEDAAERLVAMAGLDLGDLVEKARSRDFKPVPLGMTTSIAFTTDIRPTETANVGGVLPGSDPKLADEFVVYSSHHDHFGFGEPDETGDRIYNGALDNGVAMAQNLAVAEAFAALPTAPRRSMLFLFVAAEEQGLLGSAFFANSGVFPPGKIAADINFELGNVWGKTRDVTVYGLGKSELDDLLRVAADLQGRTLTGETDVKAGWYYRSDHFSFARVGVPATWFKSGTDFIGRPDGWGEATYASWIENRYHKPSDEVTPEWVYDGLAEDARLAFTVGAAVATGDEMPRWYPGDEFEGARQRALAEVGAKGE